MKIDPSDLRKSFDQFVATPEGKQWLDNMGLPGWVLLIASALQAFCGWLMLFTIIWLPRGLRWIVSGVSFRPYRHGLRKNITEQLDQVQIIPARRIMVGPSGAALVLGSFSPIESETLTRLATQFFKFYRDGSGKPRDQALVKLLLDDVFQFHRRRRVPEEHTDGLDLFLFDLRLDTDECDELVGHTILGLAATPGLTGVHVQLPCNVVQRALATEKSDADREHSALTEQQLRDYRGEMGSPFLSVLASLSITTKAWSELLSAVGNGNVDDLAARLDALPRLSKVPGLVTRLLSPALLHNDIPMLEFLVSRGANVHWFGVDGPNDRKGPVHCAVISDAGESVEWLMANGASLQREVGEEGESLPLTAAVNAGNLNLVRLLVEHGADINGGRGSLSLAEQTGDDRIADYLRSAGAKTSRELGSEVGEDESAESNRRNARQQSSHPTYIEHLAQLGRVEPKPILEGVQGHPPLKIHVVTEESGEKYLVTEGMSARPMTVPPGGEEYQYAELSVYLRDKWPIDAVSLQDKQYRWPIDWLRKVARYPHQNQTWLGGRYAIIANGEPPAPLGPSTELTCLLIIANPTPFGEWVREDGRTVVFYDVIPLYTEERDYELQHGMNALMGKLQAYAIAPWVNPRRVNTCLLSEEEEAAIDATREQRDAESDTYALAANELDARLDELEDYSENAEWKDEADGSVPQASRRLRSDQSDSRPRYKARVDRNEQGEIVGAWWIEFLKLAGNAFAVVAVATLIGFLFPALAIWLMVGFVLAAIGLLVRAWILAFRHAMQHDKSAAVLFIFPWYFVKYGIRNWPKTRDSVFALGLFLVWVSSVVLIGMPIQVIANLIQPGVPNGPVVANAPPQWADLPNPAGVSEAMPQDPDVSPRSIHQQQRPDGMISLTITWADGTVGSWVRPALSRAKHDRDYFQQQTADHRKERELHQELSRAEVGAVIVTELRGAEAWFIYGGQNGIYSLASSPGTAAVHAGLVKVDQLARLKLTIVPRPARFPMLKQNGLISISQGPGSEQTAYQIELAKEGEVSADAPATDAEFGRRRMSSGFRQPDLDDTPDFEAINGSHALLNKIAPLRSQVGAAIIVEVIGSSSNWIYGGKDQIYTIDSDPSVSAVHAGFVKVGESAKVKLTIVPQQRDFPQLRQNRITSRHWPGAYAGYRIELAKDDDQ